jgi:hypothetical protein
MDHTRLPKSQGQLIFFEEFGSGQETTSDIEWKVPLPRQEVHFAKIRNSQRKEKA